MNPRIIAWCVSEQMHISSFLWWGCTGEKLRGLNWGFVSCYTSAFQPLSHELVKSWWDVLAGAAFEMLFSHAQDLQKQLMTVSVLSHVQGVLPPFPPGAGVIAPGQLHSWCCVCQGMCWLLRHHFPPGHCQALGGRLRPHGNIPYLWAASWTTMNRGWYCPTSTDRKRPSFLLWKTAEW